MSTCETPFGLVYGSEVVAPIEIVVVSHGVRHFEMTTNDKQRCVDMNLVELKDGRHMKFRGT